MAIWVGIRDLLVSHSYIILRDRVKRDKIGRLMADTGQEGSNAVANVVDSPSDHHLQGKVFLSDMQIPSISQPIYFYFNLFKCFSIQIKIPQLLGNIFYFIWKCFIL